jgi:hypothetical protein
VYRRPYLQEDPINVLVQDAPVDVPEAVQHPGLLIVRQVLNGQVVAQGIASLHIATGEEGATGRAGEGLQYSVRAGE